MPDKPNTLFKNNTATDSGSGERSRYRPLVLPINIKQRVQTICGIMAGAFGLTFICSLLLSTTQLSLIVFGSLSLFMVLFSIGALFIIKTKNLSDRSLITFGLMYIIIGAAAMSVGEVVIEHNDDRTRSGITGICIWIIVFPVFIPARPIQTLATAFIAASILPFAYFIGQLMGLKQVATPVLIDWFLPGYFCAALAAVMSKQISHWSRALAQAQQEAEELGSYHLIEQISEGGMGTIWKAKHRFISQIVAIKFINTDDDKHSNDHFQFYQEADAIARLSSPHTISILDYGVSNNGSLYYAMDYIDGYDLEKLVVLHGRLPINRILHILLQICESIAEAHLNGLIHRDIKPANIMVSMMGTTPDFIKVLDFGLVEDLSHDTERPHAGTPGYMAPEVIKGEAATPAADVYAIGCVAYWLLSGEELFQGISINQILSAHLRKTPKPISSTGSKVPQALDDLIARCLSKQTRERPVDASILYKDLYEISLETPWDMTEATEWWLQRSHHKHA